MRCQCGNSYNTLNTRKINNCLCVKLNNELYILNKVINTTIITRSAQFATPTGYYFLVTTIHFLILLDFNKKLHYLNGNYILHTPTLGLLIKAVYLDPNLLFFCV